MTFFLSLLRKIEVMIIEDFEPFIGQHCETTATGGLLQQIGISLSEPMLFGIGQGLGYIFWNMKVMGFPFIGGRIKPDQLTQNLCRNLHLNLHVQETNSTKKAWEHVQSSLDQNKAVGLKLDCYHLEYFTTKIHFAGHYATIYGYDENCAYLNDTNQQGRDARTSLQSLASARNEKGPMSSRNLSYTITQDEDLPDLKKIVDEAIRNNANDFLNPPIKNMGYKGIHKTGTEIKKWFDKSLAIEKEFHTCASLMERGGTGGSLFRNIYRDFLLESASLLDSDVLFVAGESYKAIARKWQGISELFMEIGHTQDMKYVMEASTMLIDLSKKEFEAMEPLLNT